MRKAAVEVTSAGGLVIIEVLLVLALIAVAVFVIQRLLAR